MRTVRYFDGKTYDWVGISRQPNIIGKVCLRLPLYSVSMLLRLLVVVYLVFLELAIKLSLFRHFFLWKIHLVILLQITCQL